jgi:hypothetical protein
MGRRITDIRNWDSNKDKRSKDSKAASSARSGDMDKSAELDKPVPAGTASAWADNRRVLRNGTPGARGSFQWSLGM